eukprot:gene69349-biopygen25643
MLYSTHTLAVKEILSSNKGYPAFDALPSDCILRSDHYLAIMLDQLSKGNSKSNINEITKFLFLTQEPNETEAAWTNRLVEHFNRIEPILSPAPSVPVLLRMLLYMVLIKGTDRRLYSNILAIEVFVDKYPDLLDSLQHFEELRTGILSRVGGDLNQKEDSISAQGSAFPAIIENPPPVALLTTTTPQREPSSKALRGPAVLTIALTASLTSPNTTILSNSPPTPTDEQLRTYLASMGYVLPDTDEDA